MEVRYLNIASKDISALASLIRQNLNNWIESSSSYNVVIMSEDYDLDQNIGQMNMCLINLKESRLELDIISIGQEVKLFTSIDREKIFVERMEEAIIIYCGNNNIQYWKGDV